MSLVCKEVDGVEHHIVYCIESKKSWSNFKTWMVANLNFGFDFTAK